ncbi:MAG: MFS transporter [Dehalococcoidia bacterium]|nr:MFS transporter [Dehalococcoidia bacterium]
MEESKTRVPSHNLILFAVCAGIFVAALDQTVIYGALNEIMFDLHMNVTRLDQVSWLVSGYLLGYTFAMPLVGRISDVYGHRRMYILSLLVFMVGSVLIALMASFNYILAARVVQAIGGGAVVPVGMAIIGDTYPLARRAIALGILGGAVELGGALGPLYGSVIAEYLDWHWIFWINVPVGLIVIPLIYFFVKPSQQVRASVDYRGGLMIAAALAFMSIGLSQQLHRPNAEFYMAGLLLASIFLFGLFILREQRAAEPLVKLHLFRDSTFSAANITHLFIGGALIIAIVIVPVMAATLMGVEGVGLGLRLGRLTFAIPIGAVIGGFLCHRLGYRIPTAVGLLLSAGGFLFLWRWTDSVAEPWLTIHLVMCGLGFGLVIAPITTAVLNSVGEGDRGVASALVTSMRMIGMIIGLALMNSWGMGHFHVMAAGMSLQQIEDKLPPLVLDLFHNFFLAAAIVCLLALVPAMWIRRREELSES